MQIRKTTLDDIPRLIEIFASARAFMRQTGNPDQWAETYPSREQLEEDIQRGDSYVCQKNDSIEATFVLREGNDPTYETIYEGQWLNALPYLTIHRIASSGNVHGIFFKVLAFALQKHDNIRIDTHRDNQVMQHILLSEGFQYCGIIHCWNGSERLAYQYVDNEK